jgi:hypothetical protein
LGEPLPLDRERDPSVEPVAFCCKLMEMRDQLTLGHQVEAGHATKLAAEWGGMVTLAVLLHE